MADLAELNIRVKSNDVSKANKALSGLNNAARTASTSIEYLKKQLGTINNAFMMATMASNDLAKNIKSIKKITIDSKSITLANTKIRAIDANLKKLGKTINNTSKKKMFGSTNSGIGAYSKDVAKTHTVNDNFLRQMGKIISALKVANKELRATGNGFKVFRKNILNAVSANNKLTASTKKAQTSVKNFNKETKKQSSSQKDANKSIVSAVASFKAYAAILGARKLFQQFKNLVNFNSDFTESLNRLDVAFEDNAVAMRKWSAELGKTMGADLEKDVITMAADFQTNFKSMGFSADDGVGLSKTLTTLTADFASFRDAQDIKVAQAFQSAIVGNHRALRKYGLSLNQAMLDGKLLELGFEGGAKKADEQQKSLVRLMLILEKTKDAQTDAMRTQFEYQNQMKRATSIFEEYKNAVGGEFKNSLLPLLIIFNKLGGSVEGIKQQVEYVFTILSAVGNLASTIVTLGSDTGALNNVADNLLDITGLKKEFLELTNIIDTVYKRIWEGLKFGSKQAILYMKKAYLVSQDLLPGIDKKDQIYEVNLEIDTNKKLNKIAVEKIARDAKSNLTKAMRNEFGAFREEGIEARGNETIMETLIRNRRESKAASLKLLKGSNDNNTVKKQLKDQAKAYDEFYANAEKKYKEHMAKLASEDVPDLLNLAKGKDKNLVTFTGKTKEEITAEYSKLSKSLSEVYNSALVGKTDETVGKIKEQHDKTALGIKKSYETAISAVDARMIEEKANKIEEEFKKISDSIKSSFTSAFDSIFDGIMNRSLDLADVFTQLGMQLLKLYAQQNLINPAVSSMSKGMEGFTGGGFGSILGGITSFFADGGAFSQGNVLTGPTPFMSNGNLSVAGEESPEAVMPLTKIGGKLGVKSTGGGGVTKVVNQTINITTKDADSFRRSKQQVSQYTKANF